MILSQKVFRSILIMVQNGIYSLGVIILPLGTYGKPLTITVEDQLARPRKGAFVKEYSAIHDREASKRFGTDDIDEYSFWAWRACGIALLRTILIATKKNTPTLFELSKELDTHDGYIHSNKYGKDLGWKYSAMAHFLVRNNIPATISKYLGVLRLIIEITRNKWAIASIKSRVSTGTHLVLVTNIEKKHQEIIITYHDPYFDDKGGKQSVSLQEFSRIFNNRGIIITPQ